MNRAAGQGRAHDGHAEQGGGADGQPGASGRATPAAMAMSPTMCRRGSNGLVHGRQNSLERRGGSQPTSLPLTRGFAAASQPCGHFGSFTPYPYPRGFAAPSPALRGEAGDPTSRLAPKGRGSHARAWR